MQGTMPNAPRPLPALQLTSAEESAVRELMLGSTDATVVHVQQRAAALAGDAINETGAAAVRRRSLAKGAAIAEAQIGQFQALLAAAVARRDAAAVAMLDRVATGATRRLVVLMDALRADEQRRQRPVVIVGAANAVNIGSGA
jgi:hypothetical protein